jgi:predicted anti-sigma-YlaC factor YlaD
MMTCTHVRDALSSQLDGEDPGVARSVIDNHLSTCEGCRAFATRIGALHRTLRVASAPPVPDLTAPILAAIARERGDTGDRRELPLRLVLAALGMVQLVLSLPALVLGEDAGLPVHTARHLGSFGVALAVGFLYVAWRPSRVSGLLPVMTALVACLVGSSIADMFGGTTPAVTESQHLAEVVGVAALWLLAHPTGIRTRRIVTS